MPQAFILNMYANDNSHLGQRKFSGLPVRVGRNALNDWQVAQTFVSDFHARIEEVDGELAVRDLNSKNGIYVRPTPQASPVRVAPQLAVPLRAHGFEFFVGPYLRIHVQTIVAGHDETLRDLKAHGSVLGNEQMMTPGAAEPRPVLNAPAGTPASPVGGAGAAPVYVQAGPTPGYAPPAAAPYGHTPGYAPPAAQPAGAPYPRSPSAAMPAALTPAPAAARDPSAPVYSPIAAARTGPPELAPTQSSGAPPPAPRARAPLPELEPARPRDDAAPHRPSQSPALVKGTAHFTITPESLALVGLRELATSLVPGLPVETTGDIARLVTKLHDAVEVFCRCFIPLRESHAQFAASSDLQKASAERSLNRSSAYLAVERAQDPGAVARALLDWRDPSLDAPSAVEGIFADLVVYQTALLDGVMNGIRALLEELSPGHIEQLEEQRRSVGVHLALGRYKALWESYVQLHQAVQQQQDVFTRLFGAEFAAAYRERMQGRSDAINTR